MNNPFPAETPDPNIDNPVIPPANRNRCPNRTRPAQPAAKGRTASDDAAGDCES